MPENEKFCNLCSCPEHLDMPKGLQDNWHCPLINANLCQVCCEIEVQGGFGAPDTLREVCKETGKTPQELFATCVACPHGGKDLAKPPKLLMARTKDGKMAKSGEEFDQRDEDSKREHLAQLKWLSGDMPKSMVRRINAQRGFKI